MECNPRELGKGKTEKAVKQFDEIIKKLKEEIEENLEEEDGNGEGHKEHKKEKGHHGDDDEENDDDKEKISTKNAWMLIGVVEDIKSLLL
ncbi:MAG: hypothetical protein NUV49_00820 [Patescibacteria group bacterium]|nr:hypothetical protein [Patescibacteria group bacterium]